MTAMKEATPGPMLKLAARMCAKDIAICAYLAILGREADAEGLQVYTKIISTNGDLVHVLREMASSDAHWKGLFAKRAEQIVHDIGAGLLGREVDADALDSHVRTLIERNDVTDLVTGLSSSPEHWELLMSRHAAGIVDALVAGLHGSLPGSGFPGRLSSRELRAKFEDDKDLESLVESLARSDAHWDHLWAQRASETVQSATQGLLGHSPDLRISEQIKQTLLRTSDVAEVFDAVARSGILWPRQWVEQSKAISEALQTTILGRQRESVEHQEAQSLTGPEELKSLLVSLTRTDEAWAHQLSLRGPQLVADLCSSLTGSIVSDADRQSLVDSLALLPDLTVLVQTLTARDDHWLLQLRRRAPEWISCALTGLLGESPTSAQMSSALGLFAEDPNMGRLLAGLSNDGLFWPAQAKLHAPALAQDIQLALMGDAPESSQQLEQALRQGAGISQVLTKVAASDGHWRQQIKSRSQDLVAMAYRAVLGRDPDQAERLLHQHRLLDTDSLGALIAAVAASEDRWKNELESRAPALLQGAFQALEIDERELGFSALRRDLIVDLSESGELGAFTTRLVNSDAVWRQLFALRLSGLLSSMHVSLLGSEPDADLLLEWSKAAASAGSLAPAMERVSRSRALWDRQVAEHSTELVDSAFKALLDREPDPGAMSVYSDRLRQGHGLDDLMATLARSEEHWKLQVKLHGGSLLAAFQSELSATGERSEPDGSPVARLVYSMADAARSAQSADALWQRQSESIVDVIYRSLLGRPADASGLSVYGPMIDSIEGMARVMGILGQSDEHTAAFQRTVNQEPDHSQWMGRLEYIDFKFTRLLGRRASMSEVKDCMSPGASIGQSTKDTVRIAVDSGEPLLRADGPRVLLFGAFGNGNLGDAYQAMAMREIVMAATGLPSESIFATSFLGDVFPFPISQKLGREAIMDAVLVNGFDALVIGGGGLLAHPHRPLMDGAWARGIHTPIVLFSIGASSEHVVDHGELLERAWFVSGRDEASVKCLRAFRPDAILVRDPIACMPGSDVLCAEDGDVTSSIIDPVFNADQLDSQVRKTLWILKHPTSASDVAMLGTFSRHLLAGGGCHRVVAIEPHLDEELEAWFPGAVEYVTSARRLTHCIRESDHVVSMRYHGAIFSGLAGRASTGCSQPKLNHLYDEMAWVGRYESDPSEIVKWAQQQTAPGDLSQSAEMRFSEVQVMLRACLQLTRLQPVSSPVVHEGTTQSRGLGSPKPLKRSKKR